MQKIRFGKYTIDHNGIREEEEWPSRDGLPTGDPHGDICEKNNQSIVPLNQGVYDPYVEGYKQWKKDQETYENTMKPHLKKPEGKVVNNSIDFPIEITLKRALKCNCGTEKVYGKVPLRSHSHYCDLRKGQDEV